MRRLYVCPHNVVRESRDLFHPMIGAHFIHLLNYTDAASAELLHDDPTAWEQLPEVQAWTAAGSPVLLATSFAHSEYAEEKFHTHPAVAVLPDPTSEGKDKIKSHIGSAVKKLKQNHLDDLKRHSALNFDIDNDTILDLSRKASAVHPEVRLKHVL